MDRWNLTRESSGGLNLVAEFRPDRHRNRLVKLGTLSNDGLVVAVPISETLGAASSVWQQMVVPLQRFARQDIDMAHVTAPFRDCDR
ncbi:putative glycoside hydrolase [Sphingomonas sp. BAUL-RG-20F-R05-02]|uniref:putative glycoside hydrolase n=1 Tax=Sphingomonas sp. BAUL-RG-20F-R05-02 TaxID=2914830 RepID=UPI00391F8439